MWRRGNINNQWRIRSSASPGGGGMAAAWRHWRLCANGRQWRNGNSNIITVIWLNWRIPYLISGVKGVFGGLA
jgi:hypothetical protein